MSVTRVLTESERWSKPRGTPEYGTVKMRVTCEHGWPTLYCCVAGATVKVGRRKLCRTHARSDRSLIGRANKIETELSGGGGHG